MPTVVSSYSETFRDSDFSCCSNCTLQAEGQTFTAIAGTLDSAKFYPSKNGAPTGNAFAKLYNITGTFGTNAVPTGAALATSDPFDVSTLSGTHALATFTFSGGNRFALVNGTNYAITFEYSGGTSGTNFVNVGTDASPFGGTPPGNVVALVGGSWAGGTGNACCFYVYALVAVIVNLTGVAASPAVGTGVITCTFTLSGVSAAAAIGTGTITIEGGIVPAIGFGEGLRIRRPKKKEPKIEIKLPEPPPRVRLQGVGALVMVGAGQLDAQAMIAPLRYDQTEIDAMGVFEITHMLDAIAIDPYSIGKGAFEIGAEFFDEELAALLDSL